jgi:hypothetical protein
MMRAGRELLSFARSGLVFRSSTFSISTSVDPNVPIEDVAGTVKDLIAEGKVKHDCSFRLTRQEL